MSPAADWEAAWPTRRSPVAGGDGDKSFAADEAPPAQLLSHLGGLTSAAPPVAQTRARSTSPGRGAIPPAVTPEAKTAQAEHAIGASVRYWSGTHQQWMDAVVTKHNFDGRGMLTTYDLDVKRGAQASKIRKASDQNAEVPLRPLTEQQNREPVGMQKAAVPISKAPQGTVGADRLAAEAVLNNSPAHNAVHSAENQTVGAPGASAQLPAAVPSQGQPPSALAPKIVTPVAGAATAGVPAATAAGASPVDPDRAAAPQAMSPESSKSMRMFEVGERVEYWSGTYSQWMQATVQRIRSDMITYDLDVKRGAQRRKMRSLTRNEAAATSPDQRVASASKEASSPQNAAAAPLATSPNFSAVSAPAPVRVLQNASPARTVAQRPGIVANAPMQGTATDAAANGVTRLQSGERQHHVASSRVRTLSRESMRGEDPDPRPPLALAPDKIMPGGFPRTGSPMVKETQPRARARSTERSTDRQSPTAASGQSQNAPVGDADGRPRAPSGITSVAATTAKSRYELGRPGVVTSGSVGLTAGAINSEAHRPATTQVTPAGPTMTKAPRRLLADSSGGPTIGTRPDTSTNATGGQAASVAPSAPTVLRAGNVQPAATPGTGTLNANGLIKKVATGPGGAIQATGPTLVTRDLDKIVPRNPQVMTPQPVFSSATPSVSSHRPPNASASMKDDGDAMEYGLTSASSAELVMLARSLGADTIVEVDLVGLRAQVISALGPDNLALSDLSRRLHEAHVDASRCKERRELEKLLARTLLSRQRSGVSAVASAAVSPTELPPQPHSGVPPASVRTAPITGAGAAASSTAKVAQSTLVATGLSGASVWNSTALEVGELDIGTDKFNPTESSMRAHIVSLLGLSPGSTIEAMTGFRGGLNEGVWFVVDPTNPGKDLVLKLVKSTRHPQRLFTEAENLVRLNTEFPRISSDRAVAFPLRIFKCMGPAPERAHRYDLVVMWKARGERMAEYIAHKWYGKALDELWQIFESLGRTLAAFHQRYNDAQHGDFQPSNVFYDEATGHFSLIDIGGMGVPTSETDYDHFGKSLKLLADAYGSQLLQGQRSFEAGHAAGKASR